MQSPPHDAERANPTLRVFRGLGALLARVPRSAGPILAALWFGLIAWLSSRPSLGRPGPITGSWVLNTGHALLFGLLGLWVVLALPRDGGWPRIRARGVTCVLAVVLVLGIVDELHQSTVPGRTLSAADVWTDLTGAACVLWIAEYCGRTAAREVGLRLRLIGALALCAAAGALATWSDNTFGRT